MLTQPLSDSESCFPWEGEARCVGGHTASGSPGGVRGGAGVSPLLRSGLAEERVMGVGVIIDPDRCAEIVLGPRAGSGYLLASKPVCLGGCYGCPYGWGAGLLGRLVISRLAAFRRKFFGKNPGAVEV